MIVAIDGPAGSGKSTIAKEIARRLGYYFLNTGSFYRAYTLAQLEAGKDIEDRDSVLDTARGTAISVVNGNICINGRDVENKLHTPIVDKHCSQVSADPRLRELVNDEVRRIAADMDIVTEGRDTTTVVFPDADYKFYFDASPEIRARRRFEQQKGECDFQTILEGIIKRDENDMKKEVGALKIADSAIYIDTSDLTINEVCERVISAMLSH